ncbi:DUF3772 domain-containing protein [Halomonas maura]|uniref:DUF3772 domain-containing protein n=1 Tax=Halomonas maura TaxID=117606 RepID=UPI0025B5A836|nr:DUF3772 domain-containing protein [Halomonas maura]MDN3557749.1 DUF3772 domain-containing protein [Halomonas maura]
MQSCAMPTTSSAVRCRRGLLAALSLMVCVALSAAAQEPELPDEPFSTWERTAALAEELLDERNASKSLLENVRARLAKQRDQAFRMTQETNIGVRALQAQLASLGPPPEEGVTESEELAGRRAELGAALASAKAPIVAAEEAYERANLLIAETDTLIREQITQELLIRNPSPLVPGRWLQALEELGAYGDQLEGELQARLAMPGVREHLVRILPAALVLPGLALLLVLWGQPFVTRRLEARIPRTESRSQRWAFSTLNSLARLLIPAVAAAALVVVVRIADVTPVSAGKLADTLPAMAFFIVLGHWLGHLIFRPNLPLRRPLPLDDTQARHGLLLSQSLGVFVALELALTSLEQDFTYTPATIGVLSTPVILLGGLLFWRLGSLLGRPQGDTGEATGPPSTEHAPQRAKGFLGLLARLMTFSALIGGLLVIAGYDNLARQALVPMAITLGLIGIALVVYFLVIRTLEDALGRDATTLADGFGLIPIGTVFLLSLALAPLLALVWGARPTDIAEIWRLLTDGVQLGETRISLEMLITLVLVFSLGLLVTRWLQRLLRATVLPRTRMDPGAQTALVTGVGYLGLTIAALTAVSSAGLNLASLAVVAGALSVGIGFGLQAIVSNFVSGIILLIERPIKEGDWIEVSGYSGYVRKIAVRSTRIETFDRHDVIVPNSALIAETVKNMTLTSHTGRLVLPVGIAYGSDLERTRTILLEAARAQPAVLTVPAPAVLFIGLGENSLDFELRCYLRDVGDLLSVRSELLFAVYGALDEAGIGIPFPQREVHFQGLESLLAALQGRAAGNRPQAGATGD